MMEMTIMGSVLVQTAFQNYYRVHHLAVQAMDVATVETLYAASMVAEQRLTSMSESLEDLLLVGTANSDRIAKVEEEVKLLIAVKENMKDALGQTFAKITGEMNTASGAHLELLRQAQERFTAVENAMQDKSQETEKAFNV